MVISRNILRVLLGLFLVLACVATRVIPPFASPDENSHLLRADMLSQGQLFLVPAPEEMPMILGGSGGWVDTNFLLFTLQSLQWIFSSDVVTTALLGEQRLQTPTHFDHLRSLGEHRPWSHTLAFAPVSGTNYYNPVIYVPHAAALWLGKQLGWSVMATHDLVRVLVAALCALFCALGLRLVAFPALALAMLGTPMALFQWYSPTIDGLSLALTVYAVGLFLAEASSLHPPSCRRLVLVSLLVLVVATTRIHMLALLALPVFLAWRQARARAWAVALGTVAASVGWIAFALRSTIDTRVARVHTTTDIVLTYLQHPLEFAALLGRTLTEGALVRFYVESFMGKLGWLDAPLAPMHLIGLYLALLFFLGISLWSWASRARPGHAGTHLLLTGTALASVLLAFAALAVTWNDYPAQTIQGLQGRYFILPLFLAACALWHPAPASAPARHGSHRWPGPAHGWVAAALGVYFLYSLYATFMALVQRF